MIRNRRVSHGGPQLGDLHKYLLRDPVFLGSLILWGLNDHVFKYAWPGPWSGKLSDVTSLVCAPVIVFMIVFKLIGLYRQTRNQKGHRSTVREAYCLMAACALLMAVIMVGINVNETWASVYRVGLGYVQWPLLCLKYYFTEGVIPPLSRVKLTIDPTDGWTAPCSLISLVILKRAIRTINKDC